jgi:uncharacterized membrane protein YfcA
VEPLLVPLVLVAVAAAFAVSAAAGFGGSLILVPALALVLGTKAGITLAALLLAANNVVKVVAYRDTLPYRRAAVLLLFVFAGTALGAWLFVEVSETAVTVGVIASFALTFLAERLDLTRLRRVGAPALAFGSGATSGFSGTSGPLKGVAVRNLELDRIHTVGALSLLSLVGDLTKTAIWTEAQLLDRDSYLLALVAVPLMIAATFTGRRINRTIGQRGYAGLFWAVMAGYTARLVSGVLA